LPDHLWPGGHRIAVLVSVLLENWSEGRAPSYFPRTTPLKPGLVDWGGVEWSHYGGREGVWRLLRILDRAGVKATLFASARAAELYPEALRQALASGHDVAAHGLAQDVALSELARAEQRRLIRQALDTLERAGGRRPKGWASPVYSFTPETPAALVAEGVQWHAEALDCSMPKRVETDAGPIVALPWSEFVDNRVLRASPRDFYDVYKDAFDFLYDTEPGSLLHLALHGHFGGRPLVAAQLAKLLRYFQGFSGVWMARHDAVVDAFLEAPGDWSYRRRFFA
jgi:peptidoglycan/xylan/chitin deacetylase (PgdA/CDA1 family)